MVPLYDLFSGPRHILHSTLGQPLASHRPQAAWTRALPCTCNMHAAAAAAAACRIATCRQQPASTRSHVGKEVYLGHECGDVEKGSKPGGVSLFT
jgi:hypothetical protein